MSRPTYQLMGLIPEPNESIESFVQRGQLANELNLHNFRPQEGDSLGEYLLRLRIASGLSPEDVQARLKGFSANYALSRAELSKLESGDLGSVNEQRLRLLATLYGVPHEWVLQTAQYHVENEISPLPPLDNAFAMMTMRSVRMDTLDADTRRVLDQVFVEIVSAVQNAQLNVSSNPSSD